LTRLDTISLTISFDFIQRIEKKKFTRSKIVKSNGTKIIIYTLDNNTNGINKITYNETSNKVLINISSKILGLNYPKGICLDTIEQTNSIINKNGIVLLPEFINNSTLNSIDVKNDLSLSLMPENYIHSLYNLIAPKFTKTMYPSGISFNELIQEYPIRLTGYDKAFEMHKNKRFYKEYPILLNYFTNVLRLESRLSKRATIRKHLNSNYLIDVLNFNNLNYNTLTKIIDNQTSIKQVFNTNDMTNTQEKNFTQIYYLNEIYNGNFESIINHIKSKLGSNTKATYQRKQVKKYLAMINNSKDQNSIQNIVEIQNALREV
jgi:hypothetical protein